MKINSTTFICTLPHIRPVVPEPDNSTDLSRAEEEKERLRARKKGWELLRPLEGNCMFYVSHSFLTLLTVKNTGWWTYAFCHNRYVKQFHALPPGNGNPPYPPVEDPTAESFVLGQTPANEKHVDAELYGQPGGHLDEYLTSVDAVGEQRYLVQKMEHGTWCELIKKNRRIEVQFQCDPSGGDRIAWIKETTTCSYLMVIHTPKLCNDLAFAAAKKGEGEGVNQIICQKVGLQEEIESGQPESTTQDTERLELPSPLSASQDDDYISPDNLPHEQGSDDEEEEEVGDATEYLEFVIPPAPLDSALKLLEETIAEQIADGSFLRPDGTPYTSDDEEPIEYRVELVDDEENRVFGVLKVKISKGAIVETAVVSDEEHDTTLPESLRKEIHDWVEGKVSGGTEESDKKKGEKDEL
jgi:Glucosidase II beta subunit-like protein